MQSRNPVKPGSTGPQATEAERLAQRFSQRFGELRGSLQAVEAQQVADRSGAAFEVAGDGHGRFSLPLWGRTVVVTYPEYEIFVGPEEKPGTPLDTAFTLYYLATADGAPLEDRWVAFSELPDGRFYNQAFQGYTGNELRRSFGDDQAAFEAAAGALGGARLSLGDAAFTFQALPRVPVTVIFWRGDEDFPSSYQLLFDASVSHYLPTDACAVLGSVLTHMLIKAR